MMRSITTQIWEQLARLDECGVVVQYVKGVYEITLGMDRGFVEFAVHRILPLSLPCYTMF